MACIALGVAVAACAPNQQAKSVTESPRRDDQQVTHEAPAPSATVAASPSTAEMPSPSSPPAAKPPTPQGSAATQPGAARPQPSAAASKQPPAGTKVRAIHPHSGNQDCMEMYGFCTPPPDQLCTSSAFVLSCGETGQLPGGSREWLRCICP